MAGFYNPSTPDTLGLEWLVDEEPSTFVLDSASKAYGQYLPGAALKRSQELAVWADSVQGSGVFGCACYSAPYIENVPQSFITCYAGTDTGAEFTSPTNGGNAWLTQAGGAASYASVSPGADDTTYLKNVNQREGPTPARMMMRGAGAQTVLAGRRILDVELKVRVKTTLQVAVTLNGCLNISGIDYVAAASNVPLGQGYNDVSLGRWFLNPSTGLPWTVPELNLLVTTGATDEFGFLAVWNASYLSAANAADTIRVAKVWLSVRNQPEDRVGYASGTVTAYGWQGWTAKSVPNLISSQDSVLDTDTASTGTWVAGANTTLTNDTDDPGGGLGYTRSLKIDPTAAGTASATSGFYPCIAGKTYSFRALGKATASDSLVLTLLFYDANGTLLQTSNGPSDVGDATYNAVGFTAAVTAPTNATQFKMLITFTASAGTDTLFVTQMFVGLATTAITFVRETSPGGATITKVNGSAETSSIAHPTDELRIFRRISSPGTGIMSLSSIGPGASAVGMPLDLYAYRPQLQDSAGAILSLGTADSDCTAVVTTSLAGWDSANGPIASLSQVYARRQRGLVNTGNTIESEMTLPVETYLAFRLVVAGEVDEPAANLVLGLYKRSDNSQVGGDAIIAPTDLEQIIPPGGSIASRTTPQVFVVAIPTPAASAAVQYYVKATSTAAAGSGWVLYALDTMGYTAGGVSIDTIAFGANVDAWTDPGDGGELTRRNGMITVQTQPDAPANVTATADQTVIEVAWDATSVGGAFAANEVWRTEDGGVTYLQVADLADEADVTWRDQEAPRGVDVSYVLRTRRTDGSLSDWSTATAATQVDPTIGPWFLFSSNETAESWAVAAALMENQSYKPPDRRVLREFAGRDGAVAFLPLERSLDEFEQTVALYWEGNALACSFLQDPPTSGRAAFNALERLCIADVSYVCIRDPEGNRWFASVACMELLRGAEGRDIPGAYLATLHVRELTQVPSTPTGSL